jgi:hypothetical protein
MRRALVLSLASATLLAASGPPSRIGLSKVRRHLLSVQHRWLLSAPLLAHRSCAEGSRKRTGLHSRCASPDRAAAPFRM